MRSAAVAKVAQETPPTEETRPVWPCALFADVERGLEELREREIQRRSRKLQPLNEEQMRQVDELTRDLLRHAVLDRLCEIQKNRHLSQADLDELRKMLPTVPKEKAVVREASPLRTVHRLRLATLVHS